MNWFHLVLHFQRKWWKIAHISRLRSLIKSLTLPCSMRTIKRKVYPTHNYVKAQIFNFIEMFYNPKKRHSQYDTD